MSTGSQAVSIPPPHVRNSHWLFPASFFLLSLPPFFPSTVQLSTEPGRTKEEVIRPPGREGVVIWGLLRMDCHFAFGKICGGEEHFCPGGKAWGKVLEFETQQLS